MARIPDSELERLKKEVPIERLKGIETEPVLFRHRLRQSTSFSSGRRSISPLTQVSWLSSRQFAAQDAAGIPGCQVEQPGTAQTIWSDVVTTTSSLNNRLSWTSPW